MGDDALKGDKGHDFLAGGPGADKLFGGEFDPETETPGDDDAKEGMWDADMVAVRMGIIAGDTADYSKSDAGVTIDLDRNPVMGEGGDAEGDTLVAIENLIGSAHDDELKGTDALPSGASGANVLMGMDGDDTLHGRDGDDVLLGGNGDDMLRSGGGNDTVVGGSGEDEINGGTGIDVMDGGAGDDVFVYQGMTIDDAPTAAAVDDTATDGANEALHRETAGDMRVDGGGGMDTIDASGATPTTGDTGLYVNLNTRVITQQPMAAVEDDPSTTVDETRAAVPIKDAAVYISIDKVIGGDLGDTLIGNARTPTTLMGGGGNDTLTGGTGSDTLAGGSGTNQLTGGDGADTFVYGSGTDVIHDFEISVRGGATDQIDLRSKDLTTRELGLILKNAHTATETIDGDDVSVTYLQLDAGADRTFTAAADSYDIRLIGISNSAPTNWRLPTS